MLSINNYITEKLHISKNYKDVDKVPIKEIRFMLLDITNERARDIFNDWYDTWFKGKVNELNVISDFDTKTNKKLINIPKEYDDYIKFDKKTCDELEEAYPIQDMTSEYSNYVSHPYKYKIFTGQGLYQICFPENNIYIF